MAKRALWLAAATIAAIPFAAQAGDAGWYVGAGGGANWKPDADVSTDKVDSDIGWLGLIRGGYDYGNGWRTELEAGYRNNGVDKVSGVNASGDTRTIDAMVNVLYEFETGSMFRPYLGAGAGGAQVNFKGVSPILGSRINEGDIVFAYQAIAGVGYNITPAVQIFAEGRFLGTDQPDFVTDAGTEVDADNWNYSALVGVTYKWLKPKKAPEPPPPEIKRMVEEAPPPAPAPVAEEIPRNFIIFFDWDRDNISPEAMAILEEAAQYAKQAGVARIVLTGYADRSGSVKYNQGLSQRRADNARAAMVQLGISASEIAVFAKGESDPLVPTADGVREPQNRRVEIVLE
jgi:outer membrane protein OmpA-like peptidoglycan-associated protein/outer membrane protein W